MVHSRYKKKTKAKFINDLQFLLKDVNNWVLAQKHHSDSSILINFMKLIADAYTNACKGNNIVIQDTITYINRRGYFVESQSCLKSITDSFDVVFAIYEIKQKRFNKWCDTIEDAISQISKLRTYDTQIIKSIVGAKTNKELKEMLSPLITEKI